jgi:arylsulfatase A-like enzyme
MLGYKLAAGALLAVMVLLGSCGKLPGKALPGQPNVVLISIDSLRADHLSGYGYHRLTSPNLDRFAREGALFENAIAESSWTLPTHVSMLTGLSSSVHGVELDHLRLAENVPTLASLLRNAGYRTGGIYSGPYLHPVFGFSQGFDEYEGVYGDAAGLDQSIDSAKSPDERRRAILEANREAHHTITAPAVTEKAIDFLRRHGEQPFFLFLHYFDVHYDYRPPEWAWRRFDPDYDGPLAGDGVVRIRDIRPGMAAKDLDHVLALYDGEILFTDRYIGYFLERLERQGLAERTIVVITADHGEEFFEHGGKGHRRTLYEEVLRVPLLVRFPGRIPPGARLEELVRHIDIAPTILSLLGIEPGAPVSGAAVGFDGPARGEGRSAVSRLANAGSSNLWISSRTREHKYLLNLRRGRFERGSEILYDLVRDPGEQEPIATEDLEKGNGPAVRERFRQSLEALSLEERSLREFYHLSTGERVELPEEVREQLRSLGYVP